MAMNKKTISKIINEIEPLPRSGGGAAMAAKVDIMDFAIIRRIVHSFFLDKADPTNPTVAKILERVKEQMTDPETGETMFPYGETCLRKILHQIGFRYRKTPDKNPLLMERAEIVLQRNTYLRKARKYRNEGRKFVFLDETWFNCGDAPTHTWQDTQAQENPREVRHPCSGLSFGLPTRSGGGGRLIIVNAITEAGLVPGKLTVLSFCDPPSVIRGFFIGALWVFASKAPVTPEDYHKDMDSYNFEKWFNDTLLVSFTEQNWTNVVIVMDNAPYHSRKGNTVPSTATRAEIITRMEEMWSDDGKNFFEYLEEKNVPNDPQYMTVKKLGEVWGQYRSEFEYQVVDRMAAVAGHEVLRLPPYHCIFNPIELLWGWQKRLARNTNTNRTPTQARQICEQIFNRIPTTSQPPLKPYFDRAIEEENKYWERNHLNEIHPPVIIDLEDDDDDDDDNDNTNNDDDSDSATTSYTVS